MYKAAVIGLGFIGAADQVSGDSLGQKVEDLDGTHAQTLAAHDQVQLVAGSSRDEPRRKRFTERMNLENTYSDWQKMLDSENLDIVAVATYTPFHAEIAIACAQAGVRAVICEKPLTTRLSDSDRVIDACKRNNTLLAVNHLRWKHPIWYAVRDEIEERTIGQISHMTIHWPSGRMGCFGTHMFDAASFLLDSRPDAVSGVLDPVVPPDCRGPEFHDPGGWGIVRFDNGVRAHIEAPTSISLPFGFRILGSLGWIDVGVGKDVASVHLWTGRTRTITCPPDRPSSLATGVDEIVTCLAGGGDISSTGQNARDALEVIMGFHVSNKSAGQWVSLPLEGKDRDLEVMMG